MKLSFQRAIPALSLLVLVFIGISGPLEAQSAFQVAKKADPLVGRLSMHIGDLETASLPNVLTQLPERFDSVRRYIVQFDGPMTPGRRERLEALGVELEEYIPHYAYIARLGGVRPARLKNTAFVGWIGEFADEWKIEGTIGERPYSTDLRRELMEEGKVAVIVTLFRGVAAATVIDELVLMDVADLEVHRIAPLAGNVTLSLTLPASSIPSLKAIEDIQFVEEAPEITLRNSTNRWIVQSNQTNVTPFYDHGIHGEGQVIGIMDGRIDESHCSFDDTNPIGPSHRKILAYNTAQGSDSHGTHVAGTAAGDGGAFDNRRGVAYLSRIVFHDVPFFNETAMYGRLQLHHNQGARLHTNSWGDDGTTSYNSLVRGIDSFSRDFEESLVMLACTNTSTLKNPENAKNLLAVGASQDTPSQGSFCSGGIGPTADGRRKPEIFAPGCGTNSSSAGTTCGTVAFTGTSMASPAVAGTATLIRQYYTDGYYPTGAAVAGNAITPSGALLKATLLNASVDMTGIAGYPSNQEGWGRVIADRSAFFAGDGRTLVVLDDIRNASGLSTGNLVEYTINVAGGAEKLQVTMVFTDAPASAGTGGGAAAVNDLDLEVISPSADLYLGNVFSGGVSNVGGSKDASNNVEQVHVDSPEVGVWMIRVRGAAVNQGNQGYALVATGEITQELPPLSVSLASAVPDLIGPGMTTDIDVNVIPGTENVVAGSPTLHYRADGGSFQSIPLVPVSGDAYRATLPAVECGENPEFYFSALGDGGTTVFNPSGAPASYFAAEVGAVSTLFSDDFETNNGWTVENVIITGGAWERGTPAGAGDRGDPLVDFDGSGKCYLTENFAGNSDVDGGPTRIISPLFDLSGTDAMVSFGLWFFNDSADDSFQFQISVDGGSSYMIADTTGPGGGGGWVQKSFRINDFIVPNNQVRFRFQTSDNPNNSITEAAVDAFMIDEIGCTPVGDTPDLSIQNIQVDYDPTDGDVDAGPGALGQAADVIVTIRNTGNLSITSADLSVEAQVNGGSLVSLNQIVTDFGAGAGTQPLAAGAFADVVFSFAADQLDRCGTYTLTSSHAPANLVSDASGGGSINGDTNSANDSLVDHPDNQNDPNDSFSPDLLELEFGTLAIAISPGSVVIENIATEKLKIDLDFAGLGPGMDMHDVRLDIDLSDNQGVIQYLSVFSRTKTGAPSSGTRSLRIRIDLDSLFPALEKGRPYRVRMRLTDLNSSEVCILAFTPNSFTVQ